METAVRKATRLEYAAPKLKHLITLTSITYNNPALTDSILACLEKRLKERTWIIPFKVLEIVHFLIREGNTDSVIRAIIKRPAVMDEVDVTKKKAAPTSVKNLSIYRTYLNQRVSAFKQLERDFIGEAKQEGEGRLRRLSIASGLLEETAALQTQVSHALECRLRFDERQPHISMFAYQMVLRDILTLFQLMNEGVLNILEHYFEMNKHDAKQALVIYKTFAQQTEEIVGYLDTARRFEDYLLMKIPSIKHAPLSLVTALEEYLNDEIEPTQPKQQAVSEQTASIQTPPMQSPPMQVTPIQVAPMEITPMIQTFGLQPPFNQSIFNQQQYPTLQLQKQQPDLSALQQGQLVPQSNFASQTNSFSSQGTYFGSQTNPFRHQSDPLFLQNAPPPLPQSNPFRRQNNPFLPETNPFRY